MEESPVMLHAGCVKLEVNGNGYPKIVVSMNR